ncbi:LuxR family transcriptional regulator [Agrobacterium sp. Ap1]|jgi:DNA-binding CsgD family transcriptional regulator|uniref:helix-turn-helix transcriptional regulator n=1 Tax=Rhizobium/Agrobacterium group TaxID=227290 RepID=UPI001A8EEDCA|nr:LuxR family transcriptional regulator [Agrobacterium sp. Ap1]MBO0144731.1 LuxR family transcriptional regulator [Agrobacterium sp. Ap1]
MDQSLLSWSLGRLEDVDRIEEMTPVLGELASVYEFNHMTFVIARLRGTSDNYPFYCTTYPSEWTSSYSAHNFVSIDPVMRAFPLALLPIDWATLDWRSAEAERFRLEALSYDIGPNGLSVPVRGPRGAQSLLSASSAVDGTEWFKFRDHRTHDMLVLSHYLYEKILRISGFIQHDRPHHLSKRERECLCYLANGSIAKQTAMYLQISESAVRLYLQSARRKLGVRTSHHAVAKAIILEIISADSER